MSRSSRARNGKRSNAPRHLTLVPAPLPAPVVKVKGCECPECAGGATDFEAMTDELFASAGVLVESGDPLDAEILGAAILSSELDAEYAEPSAAMELVRACEQRATPEALAVLLAVGSVAAGELGTAASEAADRLIRSGVSRPGWAADLDQPVTAGEYWRLSDSEGLASILVGSFHRAGRGQAFLVNVDHRDCGAAANIFFLDAGDLPAALDRFRAEARRNKVELDTEALAPDEFRWQVENALAARAVHDCEDTFDGLPVEVDDGGDGPDYRTLAFLLTARLDTLPESGKPPVPHGGEGVSGLEQLSALEMLARLSASGERGIQMPGRPVGREITPPGREVTAKLPARRKKSAGPAPIYQLKVGLHGAKPPIWRRLEVPADITLGKLHEVIQVAFRWDDGHLHAFETPYGDFGLPDRELGHRSEAKVTLEQVAPEVKGKIKYRYDFGDDWEHEITVEKVLDRDGAVRYPRCTGGRRAAPPDDCGGIWGYADLVEVLRDPGDPEHEERLEWLGLADAAEFDPERFDAATVNADLAILR